MKIYWLESSVPALKGLSADEIAAAKRRVRGDVLRHWQVWVPFVVFVGALAWFIAHAERFQHQQHVPMTVMLVLGNLIAPPYRHYLQYHLTKGVVSR